MTAEQAPLAAQIEKVQRELRYAQVSHAERGERLWSAVLASLQQHERAMVALRDARKEAVIAWSVCASIHRKFGKGHDALYTARQADFVKHETDARAALDDAASAAGDAG